MALVQGRHSSLQCEDGELAQRRKEVVAGGRDGACTVGLPGLKCGTSGVNRLGLDLGCFPGRLQGQRTCLPGLRSQALGPRAETEQQSGQTDRWTPRGSLRPPQDLAIQSVVYGPQHDMEASQKCRISGPTQTY